jgi:hypothetical protein
MDAGASPLRRFGIAPTSRLNGDRGTGLVTAWFQRKGSPSPLRGVLAAPVASLYLGHARWRDLPGGAPLPVSRLLGLMFFT